MRALEEGTFTKNDIAGLIKLIGGELPVALMRSQDVDAEQLLLVGKPIIVKKLPSVTIQRFRGTEEN